MVLGFLMALAMQAAPSAQDAPPPSKARKARPRATSGMVNDDFPAVALRLGQSGVVKYRMAVDEKGKAGACHVIGSSGYSALDEKTCPLIRSLASFDPARDDAGKDIASETEGSFTWTIPGKRGTSAVSALASDPIGLSVGLQAVPKSYANPALLRMVYASDKVKACSIEISSGNAKLDEIACAQASAEVPSLKVEGGQMPQPDSRMVEVRFEATK